MRKNQVSDFDHFNLRDIREILATAKSNLSCNKLGCCKLREYCLLTEYDYAGVTPYMGFASLVAK